MTPTNTQGSEQETAWVTLARLEDLETTIADASPEELPDLHSKLLALSDGLHAGVLALIKSDREHHINAAISHVCNSLHKRVDPAEDYIGQAPVIHEGHVLAIERALTNPNSLLMRELAQLSKEDSNHA